MLSLADDVMIDNQLPSQEDGTAEQSTSLPDLVEDAEPDLVEDEEDNGLWCYCRQDEHYDAMIACDGENCAIEWFHLSCVNLTQGQVRTVLTVLRMKNHKIHGVYVITYMFMYILKKCKLITIINVKQHNN